MIRKREKIEGNTPQIDNSTEQLDFQNYKEEAIHVLNILDSKGINIYDKNRTPGMYLRRNRFLPNKAELEASSRVFEKINLNKVESLKSEVLPSNLLEFFNTNNKKQ